MSAKKVGQPMSKGGYPKPFGGQNEMGEDQMAAAKRAYKKHATGGKQKDASSMGVGRRSGNSNEM